VDVVAVSDAADTRLADYMALTDVALRRRKEPADGLFIAEGEKVIRRAVDAGYRVRSLLLAQARVEALGDVLGAADAPCYVAGPELLAQVTGFNVHRGALAAMQRRPLPPVSRLLATARRVVVLEDLNNHTNIGAIFRCAAALGMDAVVLSPRCADPLYRRAVRVSMGAVLTVPYARMTAWWDGLAEVREAGLAVLALTPAADAVALAEVPSTMLRRCAVVFGAEGPGLSRRWREQADLRVRIPMARGVDSLNVAAAAAVVCYAVAQAP
jgi:tRNA G18 (ribose-2'-O)-methylase SpoU